MIGLKVSRQCFSQLEAKPKPIAPCTHNFSHALSKIQVIARNSNWFIALFAPVVNGLSNNLTNMITLDKINYFVSTEKSKETNLLHSVENFEEYFLTFPKEEPNETVTHVL